MGASTAESTALGKVSPNDAGVVLVAVSVVGQYAGDIFFCAEKSVVILGDGRFFDWRAVQQRMAAAKKKLHWPAPFGQQQAAAAAAAVAAASQKPARGRSQRQAACSHAGRVLDLAMLARPGRNEMRGCSLGSGILQSRCIGLAAVIGHWTVTSRRPTSAANMEWSSAAWGGGAAWRCCATFDVSYGSAGAHKAGAGVGARWEAVAVLVRCQMAEWRITAVPGPFLLVFNFGQLTSSAAPRCWPACKKLSSVQYRSTVAGLANNSGAE